MRYLFVVAHPDDEVLGAGAFIFDAVRNGDAVGVVVMNSCDKTRYKDDSAKIVADLSESHRILGISTCYTYNHEDGNFHLEDHRRMVQEVESSIRLFQPDCVFTHHPSDNNQDHIVVAQSCMEAFRLGQRSRENIKPVSALYTMEVLSSTDWGVSPSTAPFIPNTFVKVSPNALTAKAKALMCYENVIRESPHPRSLENIVALATIRGSQGGYHTAEAFQCVFKRGV